ncbi:hypothetical protein RND81_08G073100 [Saponaria officinalis]|uniref:Uncharacterized protein n=1 Tax=Saponaria officinalis TaxID=3572 RepID=A0AAW1J6U0_SAPOF
MHLPREENEFADALAKLSSLVNIHPYMDTLSFLVERRSEPAYINTITNDEENQDEPWYQAILKFKTNDKYPPNTDKHGKRAIWLLASQFVLEMGQLLKKTPQGTLLVCVDYKKGQEIIAQVHDGECCPHMNARVLCKQILRLGVEIQRLNEKIVKIPGISNPLEEFSQDSFTDSSFADSIALKEIPKKFTVPGMRLYDGTTDPQDHIAQYKQRMLTIPIPRDLREVCMCKGFGSTLCGPALQWLVAIQAYRLGLIRDSELYRELTKYPCSTFEDVQAKTLAQIRLEEDAFIHKDGNNYDRPNKKMESGRYNNISAPYSKQGRSEVKAVGQSEGDSTSSLKINNLAVSPSKLVAKLDNLGSFVRWPKRSEKPSLNKDPLKWCDFHSDNGHNTEDCIALKREVAYQLRNGRLTDVLKMPAKKDKSAQTSQPPVPPPCTNEVKFISGGSDICGMTYSAAKRIAKEEKMQPLTRQEPDWEPVSFDHEDCQGIPELHYDCLAIKLQIGTTLVRRVLVDDGSSVNLVMLGALKEMGISEDKLTKSSNVLVGFSGETTHSLGEISLPTYAQGVSSFEKFNVIDYMTSYNVLLGRPWIHNLKAVASTYHQCVKVPTKWGVTVIKGERRTAQECYRTALKPSHPNKTIA